MNNVVDFKTGKNLKYISNKNKFEIDENFFRGRIKAFYSIAPSCDHIILECKICGKKEDSSSKICHSCADKLMIYLVETAHYYIKEK